MKDANKVFDRISNEFRPALFWQWNLDVDEREIDWQLRELRAKGIYEFVICPIFGLETVFPSDAWWRAMARTARRCRELGQKLWIYDDFNWPSGTAAGLVLKKFPWTRCSKLNFDAQPTDRGMESRFELDGDLVLARFIDRHGAASEITDYRIVERDGRRRLVWKNRVGPGTAVFMEKALGQAKLLACAGAHWTWNQAGYLDLLNPAAVAKFIEIIYEGSKKHLREYYGNAIRGYFTDEPSLLNGGTRPQRLPFTEKLFAQFETQFGYSLRDRLHELIVETGQCKTTRRDYWSLVTGLFSRGYTQQLADWCGRNGLMLTGHFLGEERLAVNAVCNGDLFEHLRRMQAPGMDYLMTYTSFEKLPRRPAVYGIYKGDTRGFNITAKLLASAAKFAGRERTLCEVCGVSPWSHSLQDAKKMAAWLAGFGINLFTHGWLFYSLKGFRRMSGNFHYTTGWWRHYRRFSDYCARIAAMTTIGPTRAEIAVLYPITATWKLMRRDEFAYRLASASPLRRLDDTLIELCDALVRNQWEFDFIFENTLAEAQTGGGRLKLGSSAYATVILVAPPGSAAAAERLRQFAAGGGNLITLTGPGVAAEAATGGIHIARQEIETRLLSLLHAKHPRPVELTGRGAKNILASYRASRRADVTFLANISAASNRTRIAVKGAKGFEVWRPETGEKFSHASGALTYTFEPYESIYIVAGGRQRAAAPLTAAAFQYLKRREVITLSDRFQFATEEPNLALPAARIRYDDRNVGLRQRWPETAGWQNWSPVRDCTAPRALNRDQLTYYWLGVEFFIEGLLLKSPRSPIAATDLDIHALSICGRGRRPRILGSCRFGQHALEYQPAQIFLVLDSEMRKEVFVNGRPAPPPQMCVLWDRQNVRHDITALLRPGRNRIVFRTRTSPYTSTRLSNGILPIDPADVEPIVLQGRFRARQAGGTRLRPETNTIRSGSWTAQGYPNFGGTGIYTQAFELRPARGRRYWLELGRVRDAAEIWVNGRRAASLAWEPFRAEITDCLRDGRNQLAVKVSNNWGNLLKKYYGKVLRHTVPAGLLDRPRVLVAD